jgi:hypothetical protein
MGVLNGTDPNGTNLKGFCDDAFCVAPTGLAAITAWFPVGNGVRRHFLTFKINCHGQFEMKVRNPWRLENSKP